MQIISGTAPNGAVIHCAQLCRELVRRGHPVTLISRPDAWIVSQLDDSGVDVIECRLKRWPMTDLRRIAAEIRARQVDVIHTHMSSAHFFGVLLRWMTHTPCVATAHVCFLQLHWRFNDFVIANSRSTQAFQQRVNRVPAERIETIYCPLEFSAFESPSAERCSAIRSELGAGESTKLLGIVGDVMEHKGHRHLVQAMPAILGDLPDAHLAIVGNESGGFADSVRDEAARLGVADAITWVGFRDDIPQVMAALDLCVCAAVREPLGLTAAEALAMGTPVVAARSGGLPEMVHDEQTGLLVEPASPAELARAVVRMLTDRELARRCAEAGQTFIRREFDPKQQWDRIETVLRRAAGREIGAGEEATSTAR